MSEQTGQTYYEILEVKADASSEQIEASYRGMLAYLGAGSLAMYSMMEDDQIATLRTQVDEAYRTLRDPERRAAYDRSIGRPTSAYPTVVVPHAPSDSHVTLGQVVHAATSFTASTPSESAPAAKAPLLPSLPLPEAAPVTLAKPSSTAAQRLTPVPPAVRVFEAGTVAMPARGSTSPLAVILKRPAAAASNLQPARRLHPKPDFDITPETEYNGALLRRLRESCNATLDDLGEITKVTKRYLRAVEDSDFESLPAAVYVRGFVAEYARALGLDVQTVTKSYMAVYKRFKGEGG